MKFGPALAAGPSHRRRVVVRSRHRKWCRWWSKTLGWHSSKDAEWQGREGGGCVEAHANRVVAIS